MILNNYSSEDANMNKDYEEARKQLKKYIDEYGYQNIRRDAFSIYGDMLP